MTGTSGTGAATGALYSALGAWGISAPVAQSTSGPGDATGTGSATGAGAWTAGATATGSTGTGAGLTATGATGATGLGLGSMPAGVRELMSASRAAISASLSDAAPPIRLLMSSSRCAMEASRAVCASFTVASLDAISASRAATLAAACSCWAVRPASIVAGISPSHLQNDSGQEGLAIAPQLATHQALSMSLPERAVHFDASKVVSVWSRAVRDCVWYESAPSARYSIGGVAAREVSLFCLPNAARPVLLLLVTPIRRTVMAHH